MTYEATLEVRYFKTTVRIWISIADVYNCVTDGKADQAWGQKIKDWLVKRWAAADLQRGTCAPLDGLRPPLVQLFDRLATIPGIVTAQIVEEDSEDPDIKRGVLRHYP